MPEEGYIDIKSKQVILTSSDKDFAEQNPAGLTKEGCEQEYNEAKLGRNRYIIKKYKDMLKRCKSFSASGKTALGQIVYARTKSGNPKWVQPIEDIKK